MVLSCQLTIYIAGLRPGSLVGTMNYVPSDFLNFEMLCRQKLCFPVLASCFSGRLGFNDPKGNPRKPPVQPQPCYLLLKHQSSVRNLSSEIPGSAASPSPLFIPRSRLYPHFRSSISPCLDSSFSFCL
jgi:hypothetical protein